VTLGNDNGTDGQTDRQTDRRTDRVRRNMRPPPREEGRIINGKVLVKIGQEVEMTGITARYVLLVLVDLCSKMMDIVLDCLLGLYWTGLILLDGFSFLVSFSFLFLFWVVRQTKLA